MKGFGQFCSIARALDVLGERWSLLIVRELFCGSRTFGDIQHGIPRISRTMLSARLRELRDVGVITRHIEDGNPSYALTEAGRELGGVIREIGTWGQRWLPRTLPNDDLDADVLLWDMRRRIRKEALPAKPIVARIAFSGVRARDSVRFLLLRRSEVSLCTENPGFPEELHLGASLRTLTAWWRGDISLAEARAEGMVIHGRRDWVRAFPKWFERYLFADVPRAA